MPSDQASQSKVKTRHANSTRFTKFDQFEEAVLQLIKEDPIRTRLCSNIRYVNGRIKLRATNDVRVLKYRLRQKSELSKYEALMNKAMSLQQNIINNNNNNSGAPSQSKEVDENARSAQQGSSGSLNQTQQNKNKSKGKSKSKRGKRR
ncbi:hypothetical protein MIR68_008704 [Amoeboaphelidium protococcarum]|nr:hypothetical protein MIR68_008704 [Amoeboaphelidium protococcarum]